MKNIFVIICSIIIPIFSKPNRCVNCKFFIKDGLFGNEYGKCSLFKKAEMDIDSLVTGKDYFMFCSTARSHDDMCGKEGKKYIDKRDDNRCFINELKQKN